MRFDLSGKLRAGLERGKALFNGVGKNSADDDGCIVCHKIFADGSMSFCDFCGGDICKKHTKVSRRGSTDDILCPTCYTKETGRKNDLKDTSGLARGAAKFNTAGQPNTCAFCSAGDEGNCVECDKPLCAKHSKNDLCPACYAAERNNAVPTDRAAGLRSQYELATANYDIYCVWCDDIISRGEQYFKDKTNPAQKWCSECMGKNVRENAGSKCMRAGCGHPQSKHVEKYSDCLERDCNCVKYADDANRHKLLLKEFGPNDTVTMSASCSACGWRESTGQAYPRDDRRRSLEESFDRHVQRVADSLNNTRKNAKMQIKCKKCGFSTYIDASENKFKAGDDSGIACGECGHSDIGLFYTGKIKNAVPPSEGIVPMQDEFPQNSVGGTLVPGVPELPNSADGQCMSCGADIYGFYCKKCILAGKANAVENATLDEGGGSKPQGREAWMTDAHHMWDNKLGMEQKKASLQKAGLDESLWSKPWSEMPAFARKQLFEAGALHGLHNATDPYKLSRAEPGGAFKGECQKPCDEHGGVCYREPKHAGKHRYSMCECRNELANGSYPCCGCGHCDNEHEEDGHCQACDCMAYKYDAAATRKYEDFIKSRAKKNAAPHYDHCNACGHALNMHGGGDGGMCAECEDDLGSDLCQHFVNPPRKNVRGFNGLEYKFDVGAAVRFKGSDFEVAAHDNPCVGSEEPAYILWTDCYGGARNSAEEHELSAGGSGGKCGEANPGGCKNCGYKTSKNALTNRPPQCQKCKGSGEGTADGECQECKGTGVLVVKNEDDDTCDRCGRKIAAGEDEYCPWCDGDEGPKENAEPVHQPHMDDNGKTWCGKPLSSARIDLDAPDNVDCRACIDASNKAARKNVLNAKLSGIARGSAKYGRSDKR